MSIPIPTANEKIIEALQRRLNDEKDYDGCIDCRCIARQLGLHEPV